MEDSKLSDATSVEYQTGVDTANFFEAVKASVDKEYKPQNWDLTSSHNRFEDKSPQEIVLEYRLHGHSNASSMELLLQRVVESYPDEEKRPDFVKDVMKELGDKIEAWSSIYKDKTF